MNRTTLRLLGFVVAVLVTALLLLELNNAGDMPDTGTPLLPELRSVANEVNSITITRSGQPTVNLSRIESSWVIPDRSNYTADIGKIRDVLLAMTESSVIEPKTTNPALHARLGVDAPDNESSKGILITASTQDQSFELIFGNVAQTSFRYARIAGDEQSWLIDQNPDIPADAGGWLLANIIDIDTDHVKTVTIHHPDGDVIAIGKETEDDNNFSVADIPEGRELSYSTVANGIGGALNDLNLNDVRTAVPAENAVRSQFVTFDGVRIDASVTTDEAGKWVSLDVHLPAGVETDAMGEWQETADRVRGWQYRIADYKANLLTRQWEDILTPEEGADE